MCIVSTSSSMIRNFSFNLILLVFLFFLRPPEHDAPVQGPLPYEPDDAPWKKTNESGIRKL